VVTVKVLSMVQVVQGALVTLMPLLFLQITMEQAAVAVVETVVAHMTQAAALV
jgi:hypothetical protein